MKLVSFEDLFLCLLSDIYMVEKQMVKEIPVLTKSVYSEDLKKALTHHLEETKDQVKRLDQIFQILGEKPKEVEWTSDIRTLFDDAKTFIQNNTPSALLDAAIVVIAQRIEHFEIATYGTLREFAKVLDYNEINDILKDTIKEEGKADTLLTKLAKGGMFKKGINIEAAR